jgi:hypothetical protein
MRDWIGIGGATLRAAIAGSLLYFCVQDWPAAVARAEFLALPEYDYAGEAQRLAGEDRFSEAILVVDAGLESSPPADEAQRLQTLKTDIETRRDDVLRRFGEVGHGALTGQGSSAEALTGAVAADLFVFGDVRDLIVQGSKYVKGEDTDEVIVALSAAGILLTATPGLDLGTALLKFARRAGALTEAFARNLVKLTHRAVSERNADELIAVTRDAATLGRRAQPAGAVTILKNVDDADELAAAAKFSERPGGTFALWLGGKPTLSALKAAGPDVEDLLVRAARKGRAGLDYVAENSALLLRVHPLIGVLKGFYKGNVPELFQELLQKHSDKILGLAAAWLLFEILLIGARFRAG